MFHRIILTAASVIALTAAANAADMYGPGAGGYKDVPAYGVNWGGWYIGANGGYAWSDSSDQLAFPLPIGTGFGGLAPSGGFGGGQIGYNWQGIWHPHLVLGVEADIEGAGISASGTDAVGLGYKSELDYFGTVRGRIGYAFDRALVYATGGLAYGEVKNSALDGVLSVDRTAVGYVVGGGVEYKLTPVWSVKAEYQYIDLGKNDPTFDGLGYSSTFGATVNDDAYHTFRVGVNYFVGGGFQPLK